MFIRSPFLVWYSKTLERSRDDIRRSRTTIKMIIFTRDEGRSGEKERQELLSRAQYQERRVEVRSPVEEFREALKRYVKRREKNVESVLTLR